MKHISTFLVLVTIGCSNPKTTDEQAVADSTEQSTQILTTDSRGQQVTLTDTTFNGHSVKFRELTTASFDSLKGSIRRTEIILKSADGQMKKVDSCVVIKFQNQRVDSLCNWDDGEQYEKYLVKGLWEENKLLLVNFQNWEENHDFLINLKDGSYYVLTPFYEINPKRDKILTYVDIAAVPIYSSELTISKIENGSFTTLYKKDLGQMTITDASWISDTDCLLTTGIVDDETDEIQDRKWYLATIE